MFENIVSGPCGSFAPHDFHVFVKTHKFYISAKYQRVFNKVYLETRIVTFGAIFTELRILKHFSRAYHA